MTKPFSMRELQARVKALLRRDRMIREEIAAEQQELLIYGDLAIDLARREVSLDDAVVRIKPKEYELLVFLARNRGVALSRDLILERVWGWEHDAGSRTVDVHIRWLREKIEPDPTKATRIITVRGIGYRFEG
jgi:DNA-binding response OmpR family regulator